MEFLSIMDRHVFKTSPQGEFFVIPAKAGISYCQELTNPIPMENLILVGRKTLGKNVK